MNNENNNQTPFNNEPEVNVTDETNNTEVQNTNEVETEQKDASVDTPENNANEPSPNQNGNVNEQPQNEYYNAYQQEPIQQETTQQDTAQPPYNAYRNNSAPTPIYTEQKHYFPNGYMPQNSYNQNNNQGFYVPKTPNKNNKKGGKLGLAIFCILLSAVVVFTAGVGIGKLVDFDEIANKQDKTENSLQYQGEDIDVDSGNAVQRDDIKPDENGKYSADQVSQLVSDSVVNIQVYSSTDSTVGATASGVILNKKGYIITNDHIYSEVSNAKFVITLNNGTSHKASYVAGDKRSDIAVLKFDEVPNNISPATFADSSTIKSGDDVIAIGSPYGLEGTVTKGIVSYPSRRINTTTTDENGNATASYSMRVIQTDAALNSGNSGGALVNMYGQVIGINSSKIASSGYEGLCFAIPANDAVKYAKSLVKNGVVSNRARLGITYTEINTASAVLNDIPSGLRIQEIDSDSELYTKGISTGTNGDIITQMNGEKITNSAVALDIIDDSNAGDEVELTIYSVSTKKTKTYKVKLLEDTSNTSYKNEIPKPTTTTNYYDFFGEYGQ